MYQALGRIANISKDRRNVESVLDDLLNYTLLIDDAFEKFAFFR